MRERAAMFGGEFGINSVPGVGTQITVKLPVSVEQKKSTMLSEQENI
jgi:signal transduction histidine kinase